MRTIVLAGAALIVATAGVGAADLPAAAPVYKAPTGVAAYHWSGFYAGLNLGYGVADDPSVYNFVDSAGVEFPETYKIAPAGVLGGAQFGANWQIANWVAGVETDIQATGQKDHACVQSCAVLGGLIVNEAQKLPWFGTLRGRLGIASGATLFYATGGLAYGKVETSFAQSVVPLAFSMSRTKTGWAFGGGIETSIGGNWTAKVEYLHIDLGSQSAAFVQPPALFNDPGSASVGLRDNIIRAGVNYRLGGAPTDHVEMAAKAGYASAPRYNWSGFYVGLNAGYGVANDRSTYVFANDNFESYKIAPAGALGGAQAGYNWRLADWVAGFETDIQATGQKDRACVFSCSTDPAALGSIGTVEQKLSWFGTVRGRLGITTGPALIYATGGLAYGEVQTNVAQFSNLVPSAGSTRGIKAGWTVGGGIENALDAHWTAKVEYLYVDLGSQTVAFTNTPVFIPGILTTATGAIKDNVFRAGVNYTFN